MHSCRACSVCVSIHSLTCDEDALTGGSAALTLASLPDDLPSGHRGLRPHRKKRPTRLQGGEGPGLPLQGNAAAALRDAASRGRLEPFHRVQRPKHGLWRVTLLYWAALTAAVVKQARQGHVRCIGTQSIMLAPALTRRVVRTCWAQTARCSSSACYTGVSTGKPLCSARGRLPLARRRCGAVLRRLYLVGLSSSLQAAGPVARAEPAGAAQYLNAVRYWMASCPTTT